MKLGVALGVLNPAFHFDVAVEADRLGFESVWLPEHLVFPVEMEGSPLGADHPPVPPETPVFDCFAYLSFLAGRTERVKLGSHVYLLGLRHPRHGSSHTRHVEVCRCPLTPKIFLSAGTARFTRAIQRAWLPCWPTM